MAKTDVITIRLSSEERLLYEAEAAYRKQSLSAYLRECLKKKEQSFSNHLESGTQSSSHEQGVLLEILLLLRSISSPEKMNIVQKELKRLNIPVWNMDSPYGQEKHATSSNFS